MKKQSKLENIGREETNIYLERGKAEAAFLGITSASTIIGAGIGAAYAYVNHLPNIDSYAGSGVVIGLAAGVVVPLAICTGKLLFGKYKK